jgi:hypothetical protein
VFVTFVVRVLLILLLLVDNVCWMARFHGTTLVGCLFSDGQRGLKLVGLLHLCAFCFHQIGMIASKKLRASLPFAARIASEP